MTTVIETSLPGVPKRSGKVRDVYDFGDRLLIVATDRISAFDWVLPTGIPDKGAILTQLSLFWFDKLNIDHHLIGTDPALLPLPDETDINALEGRSMVVQKTDVIPIECVVRGFLAGSGWRDYQSAGAISGVPVPPGLVESDRLPAPIFTPSTKATSGHDEPIDFDSVAAQIGPDLAGTLKSQSIALYQQAASYAETRGLILADTKFEFGLVPDASGTPQVLLIDEVLTPDSSRYWPADEYAPGGPQRSFDKQYVRDWLSGTDWDRNSPPPPLPEEVVANTRAKYIEAYEMLTGQRFY